MTDAVADQSTDPLAGTNPDMNEAAVFEAVADRIPDNPLLTMDGVDYTYRQIDELANRMGHLLKAHGCLLYTSPSPRDGLLSRMPSSA